MPLQRSVGAGLLLVVLAAGFAPGPGLGQPYTEQQIKRLALDALRDSPGLVLEIIRENPEVVTQAVAILQERERAQQARAAQDALAIHRDTLFSQSHGPVLGNPDGDVTIVEFFDYNCGYCRRSSRIIHNLLAADDQVRVALWEWPILGEGSRFAARASLAAQQQGAYQAFHWALMDLPDQATEANVMDTARTLGLDVEKLRRDMAAPEVDAHLARSNQLARALGFTGTPAFVVGNTVAPGFASLERLQDLVRQSRSADLR
ncbi:DsbA family protein [Candidatus Synechococcus spongiarum]|uniref:DsbA family protein n=1 Tax=Candidatus Synechococcus spongiarum TaxID=431041 RepID=UPI00046FEA86|nr:DsbA family protein [Candidatus Synechococcus spongiarum]